MKDTESVARGGKMVTSTSPDRSSHNLNAKESLNGRAMKGGPTDTSQSLKAGQYNNESKKGNIPT